MIMTHESLPKQFVSSVQVLFDVLDSDRNGRINFRDVESRWNKENTRNVTADVVECLRSVCPPDGKLTFEVFIAGLEKVLRSRGASFELDEGQPPPKPLKPVRLQQRAESIQHLTGHPLYGSNDVPAIRGSQEMKSADKLSTSSSVHMDSGRSQSVANLSGQGQTGSTVVQLSESDLYRRAVPRRKETARRHTLGHGVDGSMVRRSKLMEVERTNLQDGLQALEQARNWFSQRLAEVADKQRLGALETSDQTYDQHLERLNFERLRIQELSQQLAALTDPHSRGQLMHMNLARTWYDRVPTANSDPLADASHTLQLLRAQNKMLTKEVSQKNERISQLEKDKAVMLRDLFELRSRLQGRPAHYDDSTLM